MHPRLRQHCLATRGAEFDCLSMLLFPEMMFRSPAAAHSAEAIDADIPAIAVSDGEKRPRHKPAQAQLPSRNPDTLCPSRSPCDRSRAQHGNAAGTRSESELWSDSPALPTFERASSARQLR